MSADGVYRDLIFSCLLTECRQKVWRVDVKHCTHQQWDKLSRDYPRAVPRSDGLGYTVFLFGDDAWAEISVLAQRLSEGAFGCARSSL